MMETKPFIFYAIVIIVAIALFSIDQYTETQYGYYVLIGFIIYTKLYSLWEDWKTEKENNQIKDES